MLAILDTCFASNLHKHQQQDIGRTYELFTASAHDQQTPGPGRRSFTAALINSLEDLLGERKNGPFSTRELCDKINVDPNRRKYHSNIWPRLKRYGRNITLAPLQRSLAEREKDFKDEPKRAILSLQLPLTVERLTEQQINEVARALSKAVKEIKAPVKRIDWLRLQSSKGATTFADLGSTITSAAKWRRKYSSRQLQSRVKMQDQNVQTTPSLYAPAAEESSIVRALPADYEPDQSPSPQTSHKRKRSETNDDTSSASSKRGAPEHSKQYKKPLTPKSEEERDVI